MRAHFVLAMLSLVVLMAGCDKAPSSTNQNATKIRNDSSESDPFPGLVFDSELLEAAAAGNAAAQNDLGRCYQMGAFIPFSWGSSVPKCTGAFQVDERTAAEWFEKAATQGDAAAQLSLSEMYSRGQGVPKDEARAAAWYEKAVAQGNANVQYSLGSDNYFGVPGTVKDLTKAAEWWQKAAAQGNKDAQRGLGGMYHDGEGVPKNAAKAAEWWEKAAIQGDAGAQNSLGVVNYRGEGVPKNAAKAADWWQKAATQGSAEAQSNLGAIYLSGEGVAKDASTALAWYEKAAAQGLARAQSALGEMYARGDRVPKDSAKAADWYQKAAAQGHPDSQVNLGLMYYDGTGVPADKVLAYAWWNLAASSGNKTGADNRGIAEARMRAPDVIEAQRLSSSWKQGQILAREGGTASAGAAPPVTPGSLSKKGTGTLFLVSATGQSITNDHVIAGCREVRIEGREGLAKVLTEDSINDLALVQIPGEIKASAAITSDPSKLRQGEDIVVYGFPLNAVLSSRGNLTPGVVSALSGLGNNTNQIQITAAVQPGSSGSPVLNRKGEVVGVVSMKLSDSVMAKATGQIGQNVNFAVNGQTLRSFLDINKVSYRSGNGFYPRDKSTADLADEARDWTLVAECWK